MKRNEQPKGNPMNNPYDMIRHELAVLLLALGDEAEKVLKDPSHPKHGKSKEWKAGFDTAVTAVLSGFANAYLPSLEERSNDWEAMRKSAERYTQSN
jgi:hypothetical protein